MMFLSQFDKQFSKSGESPIRFNVRSLVGNTDVQPRNIVPIFVYPAIKLR